MAILLVAKQNTLRICVFSVLSCLTAIYSFFFFLSLGDSEYHSALPQLKAPPLGSRYPPLPQMFPPQDHHPIPLCLSLPQLSG